jgi:hypothetical protein
MSTPPTWERPGASTHGWTAGGWAPAGHGQPDAYPPPQGYPQTYGYPAPYAYRRPTNTLAVLALVLAFVCPPAGLVCGIVARRQIRRTGEEGAGLALAGIVVGSLWTALMVALLGIWLVAVSMLVSGSY